MIVGMYLRTTQRRNKDGSIVRYYALAENVRHPDKGHVEAKVVHSFGRADRLDRAALERLVRSIRRVLEADGGEAPAREKGRAGAIEIEASFELGVVHVVEQLWARLGIGQAITARLAADERRAPHAAALLAMAAQRLARSSSKLACHQRWLDRGLSLHMTPALVTFENAMDLATALKQRFHYGRGYGAERLKRAGKLARLSSGEAGSSGPGR